MAPRYSFLLCPKYSLCVNWPDVQIKRRITAAVDNINSWTKIGYGLHICRAMKGNLTNCMELSTSWEAGSRSATQECSSQHFVEPESLLFFSQEYSLVLSWIMLLHPISLTSIFILYSHLGLVLHTGLFPSGCSTKMLYAFVFSPCMWKFTYRNFRVKLHFSKFIIHSA
jgi:hypothetical protein